MTKPLVFIKWHIIKFLLHTFILRCSKVVKHLIKKIFFCYQNRFSITSKDVDKLYQLKCDKTHKSTKIILIVLVCQSLFLYNLVNDCKRMIIEDLFLMNNSWIILDINRYTKLPYFTCQSKFSFHFNCGSCFFLWLFWCKFYFFSFWR